MSPSINGLGSNPEESKSLTANNQDQQKNNTSKPRSISTAYLPRPPARDLLTSTDSEIWTATNFSKTPTNVSYYMGGKA